MSTTPEPEFDLESVYDEKINPLMAQIIAICKEAGMPMIASFCYHNSLGEEGRRSFCTTALSTNGENGGGWQPEQILKALDVIRRRQDFAAFTITTKPE